MRYKLGIFVFALVAAFGSKSAFADQLLTNGGFETGNFSGWILTGPITSASDPSLFYGVDTADANSGTYGAFLSTEPGQTPLVLTESLTIAPNHNYTLSFDLANLGGALPGFDNSFAVVLNGTTLFTETDVAASPYTTYSYSFKTSSIAPSAEKFVIDVTNTASYFSLDNVSLSTTVTPEPATWLLLVAPVAGLLVWRRRKLS